MSFVYGIDFGTTNSAVVSYDQRQGKVRNLGDVLDGNPIPSIVAIQKIDDEVKVGREVKNVLLGLLEEGKHIVCRSVKSALDRDEHWNTSERIWQAGDIATELFRALADRVVDAKLPKMEKAVVAIPVGMSGQKRRVLREAASRAGIEVMGFVSEPTAAFMAHAEQLKAHRNIVVFDWGGGTLDISVLEQRSGLVTEKFTAGINKAGDLIDEMVARWAHEVIDATYGLNISFDGVGAKDRQLLMNICESAKIALQEEGVEQKWLTMGSYAGLKLVKVGIKRSDFDGIVRPLVSEVIELLLTSIDKAKLAPEDVGRLLVVGGTGQLALFKSELLARWDFPNILFPEGAEWDIANGAARLATRPGSYRTSEDLGLELCDDEFYAVIPRHTVVGDSRRRVNLGLIEDSPTASFIFASQREESLEHSIIGELHAPCLGFSDEVISLECHITEDLTFVAEARSSHIDQKDTKPVFIFERLKWQYDLPEGNGNEIKS